MHLSRHNRTNTFASARTAGRIVLADAINTLWWRNNWWRSIPPVVPFASTWGRES